MGLRNALPKFDPMVSGTEDSLSHVIAGSKFLVDNTSDDENYADTKTDDDDVMSKRTNRSSSGSNKKTRKVNNSEPAQGSKVFRPIGMKKAKKLAKLEAERSRSVVEANGMAMMTKELVAVFKANVTMKQQNIDAC